MSQYWFQWLWWRHQQGVVYKDTRHRSQEASIRLTVSKLQCGNACVVFSTLIKLTSSKVAACRRFICSLWGLGVFNSTCNLRFFIMPTLKLKWAFSLFALFHWETNLEIQPHWKHTWTSCLTNNLPWYQVAVTNVLYVRKIALIVKQSFTPYWEAICWVLFLQNMKDAFSIPEGGDQ